MATTTFPMQVRQVVMHRMPHLDEIAAFLLLCIFGGNLFAGVRSAEIVVYDPNEHKDGRSEEDWLADGVLFLGCRGGMFDEHPHHENPDKCTYTLVLDYLREHLGIQGETLERLERIGREVHWSDNNKVGQALHLATVVKMINRFAPPEVAIEIVEQVLFKVSYNSTESGCDYIERSYTDWADIFRDGFELTRSIEVTEIVLPARPRLVDFVTLTLLRHEGSERLPGVESAGFVCFDKKAHGDGRSSVEWLMDDGVLFVGFCPVDEDREETESVLTAALRLLGLEDDRLWQHVQNRTDDTNRRWYRRHQLRLEDIVVIAGDIGFESDNGLSFDALAALVDITLMEGVIPGQQSFLEALDYAAAEANVHVVVNDSGEELVLAVIDCPDYDNPDIARACRSTLGFQAAIVVHRNPAGQVYISANEALGIVHLRYLVAGLRRAEHMQSDAFLDEYDYVPMSKEGEGVYYRQSGMLFNWYFHTVLKHDERRDDFVEHEVAIYNGSLTAPHVPASVLATYCHDVNTYEDTSLTSLLLQGNPDDDLAIVSIVLEAMQIMPLRQDADSKRRRAAAAKVFADA